MTDSDQDKADCERVHRAVLDRDGWLCQFCGHSTNLEVHHLVFRSHQGPDNEDNLITVCHQCHHALHTTRGCDGDLRPEHSTMQ